MQQLREFLNTDKGRWVGWSLAALGVLVAFYSLRAGLGDSEAVAASKNRVFICAETGKTYEYEIRPGSTIPAISPHSGKPTGYQAELCYWTSEGTVKEEPTPVLLNSYAGKKEPTFCPDCGRRVRPHNPRPQPGDSPPPKQAEYKPTKESERE